MDTFTEHFYQLELSLITQSTRSSTEALTALLADDFIEYGSSGLVYTKEITIASLTDGPSPMYEIYDFEAIALSDSISQTRFKTRRVNLDGTELVSLRSSLWKKNGEQWQMYFHQGTPVK